jgi:hypothetical protein
MPTAMARANISPVRIGRCWKVLAAKMNTASAIATHIRNCENLARPFWKLVTGGAWLSDAAMRPKTASAPVATAIPVPDPDWTTVPISAQHGRSPSPGLAAHGRGVLAGGLRLAGDRRLVAGQVRGLEQPEVGRDDVSETDAYDVAADDVGDLDLLLHTVAHDHGAVSDPVLEGVGRTLRLVLVPEPQADAHREDDQDDACIRYVAGCHREDRSHSQEHQQGTLHLSPQDMGGRCPVGGNRVGAITGQTLSRFLARQSRAGCAERGLHLSSVDTARLLDQRGDVGRCCRCDRRLRLHALDASPVASRRTVEHWHDAGPIFCSPERSTTNCFR